MTAQRQNGISRYWLILLIGLLPLIAPWPEPAFGLERIRNWISTAKKTGHWTIPD